MKIVSIGSSSSGNSYIIKAGSMNLLLDVGLSATKILNALTDCDIAPDELDAVLVTHEHIDHVRSIRAIARKCVNARFIASRGTQCCADGFTYVEQERIITMAAGDSIEFGDIEIRCFKLSHDASEPIGFSVLEEGEQLTVVTDTGIITEDIFEEMRTASKLVFEANHEEELLMFGPYPYNVKLRIKSDHGHLSNVTAAEVLAELIKEQEGGVSIMLAHLSEKNNTPYQASMTIEEKLASKGFVKDVDYNMTIAAKEGLTRL